MHWRWELEGYCRRALWADVYAGVTVAMLLIPQALAYALLAGVPLTAGILTAGFGTFIAAALGSSRHMIAGPTNATAILIHAGLLQMVAAHYADAANTTVIVGQLLLELTLLIGLVQVIAGFFRLGRLSSWVKPAVTMGYILGAVLALVVNQLFVFFGIEREVGGSLLAKGWGLLLALPELHVTTTIIGVVSTVLYLRLSRHLPRLPNAIVMLGVAVVGVVLMQWEPNPDLISAGAAVDRAALVGDMGGVDNLWQPVRLPLPLFFHWVEMLPLVLAISVLSSIEGMSVSRTIANQSGQDPSLNRDIFGLGVASIICALIGGMPNSGSPSRSALNFALGAKTRVAAMVSGVAVLVVVTICGGLIQYIPLASLSALLLVTVVKRLVSPQKIVAMLRQGWEEKVILFGMVGAALFVDLDTAFFIGLTLSAIGRAQSLFFPQRNPDKTP